MCTKLTQQLVLALVVVAAVSNAVDNNLLCLEFEAALKVQGSNVIICGFPKPASLGGTSDVPLACHRSAVEISALLKNEIQVLELDSKNICYMKVETNLEVTDLRLELITSSYADVPRTRRIRLLDSVAEVVGVSEVLAISGPITDINRAVFADIGPAQLEKLKTLILANTNFESIDLSLIEPLKINELVLANNIELTRITNNKEVQLTSLSSFILYKGNNSLVDCRNLLSLPSHVQEVYLLQTGLKTNCVQCYLPSSCKTLYVLQTEKELSYLPTTAAQDVEMLFPFEKKYTVLNYFDPTVNTKIAVNKTAAAARCQPACSCQKWPRPVDAVSGSSAGDTGSGISGGTTSGSSAVNASGGTASGSSAVNPSGGTASGSSAVNPSGGIGKERQATDGGNSANSQLGVSATLLAVSLALGLVF